MSCFFDFLLRILRWSFGLVLMLLNTAVVAQSTFDWDYPFTEADTLRGSLRAERTAFDVHFYDLTVKVNPDEKTISGKVRIDFEILETTERIQLDLFENMTIDGVAMLGQPLTYQRIENAVFVDLPALKARQFASVQVTYHGTPIAADNPPWDGGFVWRKDSNGNPWIGVACEGIGASLWWPNKDHLTDEPDSMLIHIEVPEPLVAVANGNPVGIAPADEGYLRHSWKVSYPINNYNVSVNIGDYAHFSDFYISPSDGDTLALDYYVLSENLAKAKTHFQQVPEMLACYEQYLDKYPFWEDGFALIETPYLGMEHQSGIAYGNGYMRGYRGGMIPADMDWDYIIIHETGHEYFGNSVSAGDLGEMWIHESFTTYLEAVYVECRYDYASMLRYLREQRSYIRNEQPIIGPLGVNWEHWEGSDHYYKGSWMLNTLRHAIHDDGLWWSIFKTFYRQQTLKITTTNDFIDLVNAKTGADWTPFFDQYLRTPELPVLELRKDKKKRWEARWKAVDGFAMPIQFCSERECTPTPVSQEWRRIGHQGTLPPVVPTDQYLIEVKIER